MSSKTLEQRHNKNWQARPPFLLLRSSPALTVRENFFLFPLQLGCSEGLVENASRKDKRHMQVLQVAKLDSDQICISLQTRHGLQAATVRCAT